MTIKQTAGRDQLGELAPEFAHFNGDIFSGENWDNNDIDLETRCIITVVALMASDITNSSLEFHLQNTKANGVGGEEVVAIIAHVAFCAGWPKGQVALNFAKEVWNGD